MPTSPSPPPPRSIATDRATRKRHPRPPSRQAPNLPARPGCTRISGQSYRRKFECPHLIWSSEAAPSSTAPAAPRAKPTSASSATGSPRSAAIAGGGAEEIDAKGKLVTPGFVDIHTHYDAQAVWDTHMAPSSWHGVTTAVMGNCGVGFAPCKPADRERLIELMEGVEDIPGAVMHEGLKWEWESFSEYLDALDRRPARHRHLRAAAARRRARLRHGRPRHQSRKRQPGRHRPNAPDRKGGDAGWRFRVLYIPQPVAQDAARATRPRPSAPRKKSSAASRSG